MSGDDDSTSEQSSWWSQLCRAVKAGDVSSTKSLLETHEESVSLMGQSTESFLSESPLHLAISQGQEEIVKILLAHGLEVTVTNLYGETPLHIACRRGNIGIVKRLLEAGSLINYKDCGECTPLFHAIYSHQTEVADLLIEGGCDLDTLNEELMTPLDHAVCHNQKDMVTLLLKGGCAIDKTMGMVYHPGHYSNTLLFSLWANSDTENVKLLFNCGYYIDYCQLERLAQVAAQLSWDDALLREISDFICEPLTLSATCRIAIRRQLLAHRQSTEESLYSKIEKLPVPKKLKDFLCLR